MNITSAPTPEADAAVEAWAITPVPVVRLEVARKLERERDTLLAMLAEARETIRNGRRIADEHCRRTNEARRLAEKWRNECRAITHNQCGHLPWRVEENHE